jgi:hypothetical protein
LDIATLDWDWGGCACQLGILAARERAGHTDSVRDYWNKTIEAGLVTSERRTVENVP